MYQNSPAPAAIADLAERHGASNVMIGDDGNVYVKNDVSGRLRKIGKLRPRHRGISPERGRQRRMFSNLIQSIQPLQRRVAHPPAQRGWMSRLALARASQAVPVATSGMYGQIERLNVAHEAAAMVHNHDTFVGNNGLVLPADHAVYGFGIYGDVFVGIDGDGDDGFYVRNNMGRFHKVGRVERSVVGQRFGTHQHGPTPVQRYQKMLLECRKQRDPKKRAACEKAAARYKPTGGIKFVSAQTMAKTLTKPMASRMRDPKARAAFQKATQAVAKKVDVVIRTVAQAITAIGRLVGKALLEVARLIASAFATPIRIAFYTGLGRPRANAIARSQRRRSPTAADKAKAIAWGYTKIAKMPIIGKLAVEIFKFTRGVPLAGSQSEAEEIMDAVQRASKMGAFDPVSISTYSAAIIGGIAAIAKIVNIVEGLVKPKPPEPPPGDMQEGQMPGDRPEGYIPGTDSQRYTSEHAPGEMPPGEMPGDQYEGQEEGLPPGEDSAEAEYMKRVQAMRTPPIREEYDEYGRPLSESSGWIECGWAVV